MTSFPPRRFRDTVVRYGLVSRIFHRVAAYLLIWQFVTLIGWCLLGDNVFMRTVSLLGPAHATVGFMISAMLFPRVLWALSNRHRHPAKAATISGRLASIVHGIFYILMLIGPALALARAYGSGQGLTLDKLQIIPATGDKIEWLMAPADLLHGPLAWTLATLIAEHITMALFHDFIRRDDMLARMMSPL